MQLPVVQLLLDRGAAVNQARNTDGTIPRFWAVQQGKPSVVQLLLNRGAVINPVRVLPQQTYAFLEKAREAAEVMTQPQLQAAHRTLPAYGDGELKSEVSALPDEGGRRKRKRRRRLSRTTTTTTTTTATARWWRWR